MRWLLAGVALLLSDAPAVPRADPLSPGMTEDEVRQRLGPPPFVSSSILLHRAVRQWHYPAPHLLRLTFDHERGRKPILREVRSTRPADR